MEPQQLNQHLKLCLEAKIDLEFWSKMRSAQSCQFFQHTALHYIFYSRYRTISLCRWGELANYSRPQHYANRQSQTLEFLLAIKA
jgi:hypothetical protein